jgi:hypothetical protein
VHVVHAVAGFSNRSLRALVAGLLGTTYTGSQMTCDLRRLRLHGVRRPGRTELKRYRLRLLVGPEWRRTGFRPLRQPAVSSAPAPTMTTQQRGRGRLA